MSKCPKCGRSIKPKLKPGRLRGLGGPQMGPVVWCFCNLGAFISSERASTPKKKQARLSQMSTAEQLAVLAELHERGSLTVQEFQTLKTRLISGND
jgi:hypothetical protein